MILYKYQSTISNILTLFSLGSQISVAAMMALFNSFITPSIQTTKNITWVLKNNKFESCQNALNFKYLSEQSSYISSLDLWIVSHGGVGSNALMNYMEKSTSIKVINRTKHYGYGGTCHFGEKTLIHVMRKNDTPPVLVILGDIWNSMVSQHKRDILAMNIAKNRYGWEHCKHHFI